MPLGVFGFFCVNCYVALCYTTANFHFVSFHETHP